MADDSNPSGARERSDGARERPFDGDGVDVRSIDALFELLADGRRRAVLSYLASSGDGAAHLEEIAAHVSDRVPESGRRHSSAVSLHHVTLPRIDETGLLEYDAESGAVRCREPGLLREFLAPLEGEQ